MTDKKISELDELSNLDYTESVPIVKNGANWKTSIADIRKDLVTKIEADKKVDKVDGKGLSTNDYTNKEKQKVADAQPKEDNALKTADKTVAGAINEVYDSLGDIDTILDEINGEDAI